MKKGDRVVYLNNAGQAPLSAEVQQAGLDAITTPPWGTHHGAPTLVHSDTATTPDHDDDDDATAIRVHFSKLIGAQDSSESNENPDCTCIAIMPSTAFAMTLAAKNIQRECHCTMREATTGRIVVLQDQMPSAVYPWQDICDRSNGKIKLCIVQYPQESGERKTWTDAILDKLRLFQDILVCCLPPLHWSDGALIDLERIGQICRERSIYLIVDATQAVGAAAIVSSAQSSSSSCSYNVSTIRPHLLTCSVHKWLRGPVGACLVYIAPELHDKWQPLDQHGRNRACGQDHARRNQMGPNGYPTPYLQDARKFDSGGKGNPILLPMLRASLEQVIQLDLNQLQEQLKQLLQPLLEWATVNGYSAPSEHCYHLVGIRPPETMTTTEMESICSDLQQIGIYIAVRCGVFRISPYLDNTADDIQRLIDTLSSYSCKK